MKKILLYTVIIISISGAAFALTAQEMSNQQNEANIDILTISYLNNLRSNQNIQAMVEKYKDNLFTGGVNWTGMNWNQPTLVNWSKFGY